MAPLSHLHMCTPVLVLESSRSLCMTLDSESIHEQHTVCQVRSGEVANFINVIGKRIDWQAQQ